MKWRRVLAVDSEGVYINASAHDLSSVMLFGLFKTQHFMGDVGEECLSRSLDGGGGDVGVLHWTSTTELFVVPRLSSLSCVR